MPSPPWRKRDQARALANQRRVAAGLAPKRRTMVNAKKVRAAMKKKGRPKTKATPMKRKRKESAEEDPAPRVDLERGPGFRGQRQQV